MKIEPITVGELRAALAEFADYDKVAIVVEYRDSDHEWRRGITPALSVGIANEGPRVRVITERIS